MIEKAKRTYATEIEGKTAVALVGDQGAEIDFPAVGLSAVFENAKRLAMAYDSQHNRASEEWKLVLYNHPSRPIHSDCRVEVLEFDTGIGGRELPIGLGVVGIAVVLPCGDFPDELVIY